MPENPVPTGNCTHGISSDNADVVHVVQSTFHHRDNDNRLVSDVEILVDEGWFADVDSARTRCEQLNARGRAYYDSAIAAQQRAHQVKTQTAERLNLEAQAIRAAGMTKSDVALPKPFVPEPFETFFSEANHTSYEAIHIRRSDHNGIAPAENNQAAPAQRTPGHNTV